MTLKSTLSIAALALGVAAAPADAEMPTDPGGLGLVQDAWNAELRNRGVSRQNPGYVRYVYNPESVFPIRAREGMITTIKLPEGEKITQAFAGDDQGFQVGIPTANSMAVRADYPGVDTNIVAYTESGRIFTFYVRSDQFSAQQISDFLVDVRMPAQDVQAAGVAEGYANQPLPREETDAARAVRVTDPYATQLPASDPAERDYAQSTDFDPRTIVEDLAVYLPEGSSGITLPYRVFRDDRFTYIDYGPNASQMTEWPTVSIVIQGVESPVGFRTGGPGGRMIIIEALGEFVLRNGQRILCIKQKGSVPADNDKLVRYAQAAEGPMQRPQDIPPGRGSASSTGPSTIVPQSMAGPQRVDATPTPSGQEEPSAAVPLPMTAPVTPRRTEPDTPVFREAPVAAADDAFDLDDNVIEQGSALDTSTPTQEYRATYVLDLGSGTMAELEDRWKTYKVQYYNDLKDKDPAYQEHSGGLRLTAAPIATLTDAIRVCDLIADGGGTCKVVPN